MSRENGAALDFTINIDATADLDLDTHHAEALITVQSSPGGTSAPAGRIAEVLIMDRSLSMKGQRKINEARRAARAAIDALPEGALLAIIAGNERAVCVFPPVQGLARIDAEVREAAKHAVSGLMPEGGTKIGQWLAEASGLFLADPTAATVRHVVLYTDGKNEHESAAELGSTLDACADQFICDVRGLGDDWDHVQLRHIAGKLHGDAEAVLRIEDLAGDFTRLMRRVQLIAVPRTYLRLAPNDAFRITAVTQAYPVEVDMTQHQRPGGGTVIDVPLGSWEERETRRYQVSLRFDPAAVPTGEKLRAVRVDLLAEVANGTRVPCANAPVTVFRHATPGDPTTIPESITQVHDQREIGLAIRACVDAWLNGRNADADAELDVALRLARKSRDPRLPLLEDIAESGPDGKVRVRGALTPGEMKKLGLDSFKTALPSSHRPPARPEDQPAGQPPDDVDKAGERAAGPAMPMAAGQACGICGEQNEPGSAHCVECGNRLRGRGVA
ncbi:MAG TPA: vWA domain-containing protein [Trebonia sp.]